MDTRYLIVATLTAQLLITGCVDQAADQTGDDVKAHIAPEIALNDAPDDTTTCSITADSGEEQVCSSDGERYYAHPLQNVAPLEDGSLPFFDRRRSPQGKAYAIGEGVGAIEEGADVDREFDLMSGVVELDVRPMTDEERSAKPRRNHVAVEHDRLDDGLRAMVDDERISSAERLDVGINLKRTRTGTITQRINRRIALGEILTHDDRARVRHEELALIASELAPYLAGFADELERMGAKVTYVSTHAPSLRASVTLAQLLQIEQHPSVQRIGLVESSRPDALTGIEKADVYQTRMFWDETFSDGGATYQFDGNNGQSSDIRAAVLDDEGFRTTHVAFKEASGTGTRIAGMWDCRSGSCASVSSYSGISDHGTAVLGAFMSDYRDGQDPAVTTVAARETRSASGGEAKAYLYWADRSQGDQKAVYDNIVNRSPAPHMLVSSNSVGSATDCDGEDGKAVDADNVYENGIAYFKSANNFGGSYCTVGPPGEAIGVFTVGGFNDPNSTVCLEKQSPVHPSSGWGGDPTDYANGKRRSIIDVLGAYCGANVPWFSSDTALGTFCGTSHSTPSVASAAVNFIDMMKNVRNSNFIDDPGVLYAWMLNMGDRRNQNGALMSTRFDHQTGAGNLRMRFIGNAGMDAPWYYYHYEMCIDDGEVYTININGGSTLSSDVDSLRAVAWWYDRRIETGVAIDDIDLRLKTTAGTTLRGSLDRDDNKERIFYRDVGGKAVKLEVSGFDVTSDVEGCGTNSMRVFVTVMVEDDDRDDADGPDYDDATCVGVDPL